MLLPPTEQIFLDFDGVINDDDLMHRKSCSLIAERMADEYEGKVEKWLEALDQAFAKAYQWARSSPLRKTDIHQWLRGYDRVWLEQLFKSAVIPPPAEDREELGWRLREAAYGTIDSVYPDVPDALDILMRPSEEGRGNGGITRRKLYIASGGRSARLEVMLKRAGLRHYFVQLFGCDTVNVVKESTEYYRRVFERLNLSPSNCLVVDDNPKCICWAQEVGAKGVLLNRKGEETNGSADLVASNLTEVAFALQVKT